MEVTPNWINPSRTDGKWSRQPQSCQPKLLAYNNKSFFEYAGAAGDGLIVGCHSMRGRVFDICEEDKGAHNNTAHNHVFRQVVRRYSLKQAYTIKWKVGWMNAVAPPVKRIDFWLAFAAGRAIKYMLSLLSVVYHVREVVHITQGKQPIKCIHISGII